MSRQSSRFYSIKNTLGLAVIFAVLFGATAFGCGIPPEDNSDDKRPKEEEITNSKTVGDPVYVTNGRVHASNQDIFIPGRGEVSLEITRDYYAISGKDYMGLFGRGWSFNYEINVKVLSPTCVEIQNEEGIREIYNWEGNKWTPPKGNYSTLTGSEDGPWRLTRKNGKVYNFDDLGRPKNIIDRNGNRVTMVYTNGRLSSVTDNAGRRLTISYNGDILISSIRWSNGQVTSYAYDASKNLSSVTDPQGNRINYGYDLFDFYNGLFYIENVYWQITSVTDPKNNRTSFSFDETAGGPNFLKCIAINYPDSSVMNISHNESLRFTTVADERGHATRYDYDRDDNIIAITGPAGEITSYTYDDDFNRISVTDPMGYTAYYAYDDKGNCLSVTDPLGRVSVFTYEPKYSFVKTVTDPKRNVTTYYYDHEVSAFGGGNVVRITYPVVNGQTPTELFKYNNRGQILQQTDAKGTVTKYVYNSANGYLQKKTFDFGDAAHINSSASFTYDALGNIISVTDPLNRTTTSEYNKIGLLLKSTSPVPFSYRTKYTYDGNRNPVKIERQLDDAGSVWQTVENTYDKRDRLTSVKEYLSASEFIITGFSYDPVGNKISQTDPNGNITTYEYDALNRLIKTIDAEGSQTENTYDRNGKLTSITDPNGSVTTYEYDATGFLTKAAYPDGTYEQFTPDVNSNLASEKTRRGDVIAYSYDNLNRLITKECPSYPTVGYTYDIASRLTSVGAGEAISYQYDNLNRVLQTTTGNKTVSYEYDKAGNRTKLIYPDNTYLTYAYDRLNRLKNIQDQANKTISQYTYDPLSRRLTLKYQNNTRSAYTYDNLSRLLKKVNRPVGGPVISTFAYTYDNASNRLTMTAKQGTHTYAYDKTYRIKAVAYPSGYPFPDVSYDYDPVGNRTQLSGGVIELYSSNNLNQYTQVNAISYSYDGNGNLTNDGLNTYSYDYENRLVEGTACPPMGVTAAGLSLMYSYDPSGRRTQKSVNGQITNYVHDGDQVIAEYDATGALTRKFIYGPGIDEPIKGISPQGTVPEWYYHFDGLGSATELTNASGQVIEKYSYDIFGNVIIKDAQDNTIPQSAVGNPYYFTSRALDLETGLYYYRARYYNPLIGRFLQTDPVGYSAGINLYAYCSNDPINEIDPLGLFVFGKRPLEGKPWIPMASSNPIDDALNTEISHEQGFFEDGSNDNIGFGDKGRIINDDITKYKEFGSEHYDDNLMRQAVKNIQDGKYSLLGLDGKKKNNCQDWNDRLRKEYEKLKKEKEEIKKQKKQSKC